MIEAGVLCSWFSWYFIIRTSARIVTKFGFPVMLKATAGGGGKGMCRMERRRFIAKELPRKCCCFGNDGMYLEKLIEEPRHIEIR
jgi:acetyl-CoA carboxylase biotin carboxylase subunit